MKIATSLALLAVAVAGCDVAPSVESYTQRIARDVATLPRPAHRAPLTRCQRLRLLRIDPACRDAKPQPSSPAPVDRRARAFG